MSETRHQLDRIENKLDTLNEELKADRKHTAERFEISSNRHTKLETQGGMVKLGMTIMIPVIGWVVTRLWPN